MEFIEAEGGSSLIVRGRVHYWYGSDLPGGVACTAVGGVAGGRHRRL
jgi:hypothetical protein